jgi:hypothetical protein
LAGVVVSAGVVVEGCYDETEDVGCAGCADELDAAPPLLVLVLLVLFVVLG